MSTRPTQTPETVRKPASHRDFPTHMEIPAFTCLRPKTGHTWVVAEDRKPGWTPLPRIERCDFEKNSRACG